MPFSGNRTKIKASLQECLVYIDMNEDVYTRDKLKIGFVLSYMNEEEAKDWRELYLKNIEDPVTGDPTPVSLHKILAELRTKNNQNAFYQNQLTTLY